jgi:hypothetical protein
MKPRTEPQNTQQGLPWSEAQDEQLRRLANARIPAPVIGFRMGRRLDAVSRRADELGLSLAIREGADAR